MPRFDSHANLKTEQALDVTSNPVVVRLDDSDASGFLDELDEMLAADCVDEFVIHGFVHAANESVRQGSRIALSFSRVSKVDQQATSRLRASLELHWPEGPPYSRQPQPRQRRSNIRASMATFRSAV
jgi:hypothetical protein